MADRFPCIVGGHTIRRSRKVALVGYASSSKDLAPWGDDDFDIFALNELYRVIPRWNRLFEMHEEDRIKTNKPRPDGITKGLDHWNYLCALPGPDDPKFCPVYMQKRFPEIAASVEYPVAEMGKMFSHHSEQPYFTSTPAYMMATAIADGYEEIHLYGIDLLTNEEYCVGPETKVLTSDLRWVPAGTLKENDEIVGYDEESTVNKPRRWRKATVQGVGRIKRPSVRLHMSDGTTLMCSREHRWLTTNGESNYHWRTAETLKAPGHFSPQSRSGNPSRIVKLVNVWDEDHTEGGGYLAAAFDGEGHLTQTSHSDNGGNNGILGFSQRPNAMSRRVERELSIRGFPFKKRTRVLKSGNEMEVYRISEGRHELVRFLGSIRPVRLLEKFDAGKLGVLQVRIEPPSVVSIEDLGEQEVVALKTSTGTFVAEGFASHNSYQRPCAEYLIGIADGMGVKVYIPQSSALCKANHVYGYSYPPEPGSNGALVSFIREQIEQIEANGKENAVHAQVTANLVKAFEILTPQLEALKTAEDKDKAVDEMLVKVRAQAENIRQQNGRFTIGAHVAQGSVETARAIVAWCEHRERGGALGGK